MPSAGEPCPNPSCQDTSMTVAGPLCGECMNEAFTWRQQELIVFGPDRDVGTDLTVEEKTAIREELLARIERIKSGDGLTQMELTDDQLSS